MDEYPFGWTEKQYGQVHKMLWRRLGDDPGAFLSEMATAFGEVQVAAVMLEMVKTNAAAELEAINASRSKLLEDHPELKSTEPKGG